MISHCTITKQNGQIALICDVDGHRVVTFDRHTRNMLLSGNPVKIYSQTIDIAQQTWERRYDQLVGG